MLRFVRRTACLFATVSILAAPLGAQDTATGSTTVSTTVSLAPRADASIVSSSHSAGARIMIGGVVVVLYGLYKFLE